MRTARRTEHFVGGGKDRLICVLDLPVGRPRSAVVFCHDVLSDRTGPQCLLTTLGAALSGAGFLCARFDFRGSGDSLRPFADTRFPRMLADLRLVVRWITSSHPGLPLQLVGLSIGGVMPALLCAGRCKVAALALLSSDLVEGGHYPVRGRTVVRNGEFYLPAAFWRERERLWPLSMLVRSRVPTKLFYGARDTKMAEAVGRFEEAGIPMEPVPDVGRFFETTTARTRLARRVIDFFGNTL